MLSKTCRRLIAGAVAALGLCWPAVADVVFDDFEDGNTENAYGQYWYAYQNSYTSPDTLWKLSVVTGGANSTTGKHAELEFRKLTTADTEWAAITLGSDLTKSGAIGGDFSGVQSIKFWVKGPSGLKFNFYAQTTENDAGNSNKHGKQFEITNTGWKEYTVGLTGTDAGFKQDAPYTGGAAFTFDRTKITKFAWTLKKSENTVAAGTFAIDDIVLVGNVTAPSTDPPTDTPSDGSDLCASCVSATFGPSVPSVLLTDFTSTKNELGYYGYSYKDTISTTTIAEGTAGRLGNGLSVEFTIAGTKTDGRYVGVGVNLSDNDVTTPLDASAFNGIYLEYKTTGLDKVKIEVIDKVGALNPAGKDFHVYLPGTNGEWRSAAIPFTALKAPSWVTPAPTFNKSSLAKIQIATNVAGSGTIAVDNVYFLGANKFPGQSDPPPPPEYTKTYKVEPVGGGRVVEVSATSISAVPEFGYVFIKWKEDGDTDITRTVPAAPTEDITFTALFAKYYTNKYTAGPNGGLEVEGVAGKKQEYYKTLVSGDSVKVTAVPDAGYTFVGWSDNVATAVRIDKYKEADVQVTAHFIEEEATPPETPQVVFAYSADVGGKIKELGGSLTNAVTVTVALDSAGPTVTAVADANYRFDKWSDGVTSEVRTDTAKTTALMVTAQFTPTSFIATYSAGNGGMLQVGDVAESVSRCTLRVAAGGYGDWVKAVANQGYVFVRWSDNVMDAERKDVVDKAINVEAIFQLKGDAVASPNREIPTAPNTEITAVAPVVVIAGEFTAGPNPAAAEVKFFRTGRAVKTGKLAVYDASGSLVTTVSLSDKGTGGKRAVGTWNLTDAKGRQVANGSYVVKGTVTTKDGKREKVSTVIAVAK